MTPTFPLQTSKDCVACSFAAAIEVELSQLAPEYHRRVTPAELVAIVGAPAGVREAAKKIEAQYPWLRVQQASIGYPAVVATWRDGVAHAVLVLDHATEYDPGKGGMQPTYGHDRMNQWHNVLVFNPPVINKWRRYALYRWFEKLFNLGV